MKRWEKINKPVCNCTHTLSMFSLVLVSVKKPKVVLPGVLCPCGKTWYRWKDGQLFRVPNETGRAS
jgi:hypothetical protein